MALEELLSSDYYNYEKLNKFVTTKGLGNVTVDELDKIVEKFGVDVVGTVNFYNLYNGVSTNKANKTMATWTIITAICTVIVTTATIYNIFFQ